MSANNKLTSAKKPFCATAVINGSTERAAVVYPERCTETLSSLGKTFLGDANLGEIQSNMTPQLAAGSDVNPSLQNISTYMCRRNDLNVRKSTQIV